MEPASRAAGQNQDLATKAIIIAYIMEEGIKADLGTYAKAVDQFNAAVAAGVAVYGPNTPLLTYSPGGANYGIGLGGGSSSPSVPNVDFAMNLAGGSGSSASFSALLDVTTTDTSLGNNGQIQGVPVPGSYSIIPTDTAIGHGSLQMLGGAVGDPNPSATDIVSFYIVGPNQFVAINLGPNAAGNGVPSSVMFFDPE